MWNISKIKGKIIPYSLACVASVSVVFRGTELTREKSGGRGRGRKETLPDKPLHFENRPLYLSCLTEFLLSFLYSVFYSTLLYSSLLFSTLLYSTLLYSTLLYSTVFYSTLLYSTLFYCILLTLLYSTLLYSTLLYFILLCYALLL